MLLAIVRLRVGPQQDDVIYELVAVFVLAALSLVLHQSQVDGVSDELVVVRCDLLAHFLEENPMAVVIDAAVNYIHERFIQCLANIVSGRSAQTFGSARARLSEVHLVIGVV